MTMNEQYDPAAIESSAQQYWEAEQSFACREEEGKTKFYCLSMLPYPSGDLHMGHVRNYMLGDVIARYQRMLGKNVLHPMGWDAFGLPAENAAISRHLPPAVWTKNNIATMRKQFKRLGYSFDWRREIATCDPEYYRWEQWLFIQLYKKGLVYKKKAVVNWDPVDQTVLANEQVIDGKGWRSGALVERREIPQWFFKITAYAEELLRDLDQLTGWPQQVRTMQRNWIGRSEGANIDFAISGGNEKLTIFTTRADTIMGVSYLAIAPLHPLALAAAQHNPELHQFIETCRHTKVAEADTATQAKKGVRLQQTATHPLTHAQVPIWVTNFVLMEYGSGAIMAVPAHDERDFEFAKLYHLPVKPVIQPENSAWDFDRAPFTGEGVLVHSEKFDGLTTAAARKNIIDYLVDKKLATRQINYRLRDWGISRQRYWGTPIPMVHCAACGDVPVKEADLPVVLPADLIPDGHASPLTATPSFYQTSCPQCGQAAKRETDTMDTFMESSWYYARYASYDQHAAMLDQRADYWTPVDQYIGGIEHAILHLLYARFMHKLLRDQGLVHSDEPFKNLLTQGMVLKDGFKMSKSKGNIVAPLELIDKYGADTVRLFIIFAAPPEQSLEWSDSGVEGAYRFLKKLWHFAYKISSLPDGGSQGGEERSDLPLHSEHKTAGEPFWTRTARPKAEEQDVPSQLALPMRRIETIVQQSQQDMDRLQFNTVVSAAMKLLNLLTKMEEDTALPIIKEKFSILLRILAPITPHITHELWRELGYGENILVAAWPQVDTKALESESIEMVVQINGKLRGKVTVNAKASAKEIETFVLQEETIQRHIGQQPVKKMIIVPKKLVNIVI